MKKAQWIKSPENKDGAAYTFSKTFGFDKKVRSATAKISSAGIYKAELDGEKLGYGLLTPGMTSYKNRTQYNVYDITDKIGLKNKIEITVAPGWAVGYFGYIGKKNIFASHVAAVCEIEIVLADGNTEYIRTDESWDVYTSRTVYADIYMGETFDATLIPEFVGKAQNNDFSFPLIPQQGDDIVENERLFPMEFIVTPKGEHVIDFGQNMTGYVEFSLKGKRGDRIVTTCAEVLDKDGNFYNANYRNAQNRVTFILDGVREKYKPEFSFQGFRYIKLEEYPEESPSLDKIRAVIVHTKMTRTGYFDCGNEEINQLYHNIIWGQKSNYLDIPTDCPQRNERCGWTGDAQVFCRTAAINYDVLNFFRKWLGDLRAEQKKTGEICGVCPTCHHEDEIRHARVSAAWGDAGVIIPWEIYRAYRDKKILEENFDMMRAWTEYIHSAGSDEYLWLGGYHYGDWLAMDAGEDTCVGATSNDLIASAFYANDVDILIKAGEVLGKDMTYYRELYKNIVRRFREYFMENGMPKETLPITEIRNKGRTPSDTISKGVTQTAIVLILHFNLCLPEERAPLADKLEELIRNFGNKMTTGFVGTPYILHVLSECGKSKLAYDLLFQNQNPSWLYSVEHGATTMWEHWNGIKEDGSFWSDDMNSFNHYAYGSVGDWLYGVCAGINIARGGEGYKKIILSPIPDRRLGFVNSYIDTVNGRIESHWYYKENKIYFEFSVPKGTEAKISLPNGYEENVGEGQYNYVF